MTSDIFDDLFGGFDLMNERFQKLFSNLENGDIKTYGYTMYRGPDGIPHVHEFGNAIDEQHSITEGVREPLSDVTVDGDKVRVVVELPGVDKNDIQLESRDDSVSISVDTESRKYEKTLALPHEVDPNSAVAQYNNGILEITFKSFEAKPKGKKIVIE